MIVRNQDTRKHDYSSTDSAPRPGHADYTYQMKYGTRAKSGGGRASARETVGRVAAGAVAQKYLQEVYGIGVVAFVDAVGGVGMPEGIRDAFISQPPSQSDVDKLGTIYQGPGGEFLACPNDANSGTFIPICVRCPHSPTALKMAEHIADARNNQDTVGGTFTCIISGVPPGIGEPCFDKLEAELAKAMLSLPATRGFEMGGGFGAVRSLRGSEANDAFSHTSTSPEGAVLLMSQTNTGGGTLGGISSGSNIVFRVAVKAVSSIGLPQDTAAWDGTKTQLKVEGRHDPCVLPRTPPLAEAMAAIVITDMMMMQKARNLLVSRMPHSFSPIDDI
eukprot:GHVO01009687.1.p1 GENE.GHVO01009687.1~~GHVO01009687.1.p1  ORF type:complete len:333 (+),score=84.00 GHVO01009687.1:320-1318(+)